LDYSHRREDGSVSSVPDSLKKPYKTSTGRVVYDGGGIDPDIKTEPEEAQALSQVLYERGLLFDFATQYVHKHSETPDARTFALSDAEYQQFVTWMQDKEYSYKSYMEFELEKFSEQAKKEKYYSEMKAQIDHLTNKIADNKKNELVLYKDQI